jgi:hypothetical protein
MTLQRRVGALEKLLGDGPNAIQAAALKGGQVHRVFIAGKWRAAPEGFTPGDLPDSAKVYINVDVERV